METNPTEYVRSLLSGTSRKRSRSTSTSNSHTAAIPDEQRMEEYDMVSVRAIRENDVEALRALLLAGRSLTAANRNGETLLHLACRRGNVQTVRFMVQEAALDLTVTDSMGRTCLHDACWRPVPDFEIMEILMPAAPVHMWLVADARGHTCLDYSRKEHWSQWTAFLQQHAATLQRHQQLYDRILGDNNNCDNN
jgi:ankyrin repeat protein